MASIPEIRELVAYDEDFLLWSEEQAELLRRRAKANPEAFAGLDIEHLVEEIADLGGSELRATESYLVRFFIHLIKAASDPTSWSFDYWLRELFRFRVDFVVNYLPSMRQRIDVDRLWRKALPLARGELRAYGKTIGAGVPERCPFTLDELLADEFDFNEALARLGGPPVR